MEQKNGDHIHYQEIRFLQQEICKTGFKGNKNWNYEKYNLL